MKKYKHLGLEQRYQIQALRKEGVSAPKIAENIGCDRSTVYRELKRNLTDNQCVYNAKTAQMLADERIEWRQHPRKFTAKMKREFYARLTVDKWSPEQIAGRCRCEGIPMVGKTTLYTYLHADKKNGGNLYLSCSHSLSYSKRRLAVPTKWGKRKTIDSRPPCIDNEERMGDFEMDTIVGKDNRGAILTLVDRKTDFAIISPLPAGKNAKQLAKIVNRRLAYLRKRGQLHSITTDNGTEFSKFRTIERSLGIPVFFAKPYCSTDKPHIEHLNKLIREFIPKKSNLNDFDAHFIADVELKLNNRPRKKLGFKTPFEVFFLKL